MIDEIKRQLVGDHRLDEIENRLGILEKKINNLIVSLNLQFDNTNYSEYEND